MGIVVSVLSLLVAIGSLVYTKVMNDRNKKEQEALRNKANRLEADAMYEKVRARRAELEEAVGELKLFERGLRDDGSALSDAEAAQYHETLSKCRAKYSALYGEIETFCERLIDGTINSEAYITGEVLPSLKQDAVRQASLFGAVNKSAKALNLSPIPKPDPSSFKQFNAVIKQYCGKDKLWMNALESIRHENSFKY